MICGAAHINKDIYVTKGNACLYIPANHSKSAVEIPEVHSFHREADPRLALHAVYASKMHTGICIVADDTDVYILLLFVANSCESPVYFRQGTRSSKEGIKYHNVKAVAEHLGNDVCRSLPAFHVATGSDYTQPFYGRSKFTVFKKILKHPDKIQPLFSLGSSDVNIAEVIDFILYTVYGRPKREKTPGECRYAMIYRDKAKTKFAALKRLPPDKSSLTFAILRMNLVAHSMVNCVNQDYRQLDPLTHGWKVVGGSLVSIWYDGTALPSKDDVNRHMDETEQSTEEVTEPFLDQLLGTEFQDNTNSESEDSYNSDNEDFDSDNADNEDFIDDEEQ